MSSNATKPNEVLVVFANNDSENGEITGYLCDYHVQSGTIKAGSGVEVSSYYDMLYPCAGDPGMLMNAIASTVLTNVAEYFELLPDGSVCTIPDAALPLWVIGISLYPSSSTVNDVGCQKLKADEDPTLCCEVVHAPMTFWWADREYQINDVLSLLSDEFNSPKATAAAQTEGVTIQYIGAYMQSSAEGGQGNAPPAMSAPDVSAIQTKSTSGSHITMVGVIALVALVAVSIATLFVVIVQRRRRSKNQKHVQDTLAKADDNNSDGPTLEVDVMSDGCDYPSNSQQIHPLPYSFEDDVANTPNSYTFDLANSMKLDVLGTYSGLPTCMAVVPPYPMEETSDSEVDSWAQTDGTVGSLEERLEEITAEI
jgi:hypothetical protein